MSLPPAPWVIRHRLLLRTSFDASLRVCPGSNSARVCEISSGTQVKDPACARCTAGRTGVRNVLFHANARMLVPDHAVSNWSCPTHAPASMRRPATPRQHGTRWASSACLPHGTQPLTAISASIRRSSILVKTRARASPPWPASDNSFFFNFGATGNRSCLERLFRPGRTACRLPGRWRPAVTTDAVT